MLKKTIQRINNMGEVSLKKATFITALSKYSTIFLNLLFSAILARLLSPEDYGIVAVTVVFTTFFSLFSDMGLGAGIIQNKELNQDDINSIFTFTIKLSIILFILFSLFSIPMSFFYKDKVYIPVGILLAFSLLFSALNLVPNAILLKQKRFVLVGLRTIILCVASGVLTIVFALLGLKYYALVLQTVLSSFATFLWNYLTTLPKYVKKVNKESISKIKNYSAFSFAFNIINYFARNTDNLLISKFMGTAQLGYYDKAYKLMCYPTNNLTHVITPVLHPILSEHQNNKKYVYDKYLQIVKLLSLCGIFIMTFCFFASKEIILIMFGQRWEYAIPCFKYLSISIWAQVITSSSGSIFSSIGDTKKMFFTGVLNSVLTVTAIILGLLEGNINSVSRNVGIVYNITFITTYIILIQFSFKMNYFNFIKTFVPDFVLLFIMFLSGFGINMLIKYINIENMIIICIIKFVLMLLVYIISLIILRQHKVFIKLLRK